jgi:GT2 family glycosyltransferase
MGRLMKQPAIAGLALLLSMAAPVAAQEDRGPAPTGNTVAAPAASGPELPRVSVAVGPVPAGQRTVHVAAGESLQAALDRARPGDVITLAPGAEYRGPFRWPRKDGDAWVVIRSASADLPPTGQRIQRQHTRRMPRLVSASGSVITADPGAHHLRLVGLEIAPSPGTFLRSLVDLGSEADEASALPHDIIIDRCYLRGDPRRGARRGVALNSRRTAIVDSLFVDFKEVGADSQAIAGWNGPGPFKIANNLLEAAGENVMFGGADPLIAGLVPADIEIAGNHFAKPLRWKADDSRYEGVAWSVKNLFELKNARRVLVEGNVLEYNWPHAQNGFAILLTVRNQDGGAPWSVVEDVMFRGNVVRHVGGGINILGYDDNHPSRRTSRIAIVDNVFADVGGSWGHGRLFQVLDGTHDVVIDHNTAFQTGTPLFGGDARPHTGFVFRNNIVLAGPGITGSGTKAGLATLDRYFPAAIIRRNIFIGGDSGQFPADNFFPGQIDDVGRAPATHGEGFTKLAERYAAAGTDGRDPGAAIAASAVLTEARTAQELVPSAQPRNGGTGLPGAPHVLFWLAFVVLGYVCVGYPILARIRAAINPRTRRRAPIEPTVTVIVAAHNEADRVDRRLRNLLALDYPTDRLEVVLGSDGSTDDTVSRARPFESAGVIVHEFVERRGKPALLNTLVPRASGDIVVFADARQRFDPLAIRALVANFADPAVGAVSGELIMSATSDAELGGEGAAMYWNYEKLIRSTESRGGSTVGATGAIYAIRKSLFEPLPDDTILDDVLIPIRIARQGYHVVFEPAAKAFDLAPPSAHAELARKARTIGGTFQLFARERWLLNPRLNPLWFETVSHKALRLAIPILLATLLVTNLALLDAWPYLVTMAGQVAFYLAAAAGYGHRHARRHRLILKLPYTMCLLSWATVVGFFRFVTDDQEVTWERIMSTKIRSHS